MIAVWYLRTQLVSIWSFTEVEIRECHPCKDMAPQLKSTDKPTKLSRQRVS